MKWIHLKELDEEEVQDQYIREHAECYGQRNKLQMCVRGGGEEWTFKGAVWPTTEQSLKEDQMLTRYSYNRTLWGLLKKMRLALHIGWQTD